MVYSLMKNSIKRSQVCFSLQGHFFKYVFCHLFVFSCQSPSLNKKKNEPKLYRVFSISLVSFDMSSIPLFSAVRS